jgi:hypothetical protein
VPGQAMGAAAEEKRGRRPVVWIARSPYLAAQTGADVKASISFGKYSRSGARVALVGYDSSRC